MTLTLSIAGRSRILFDALIKLHTLAASVQLAAVHARCVQHCPQDRCPLLKGLHGTTARQDLPPPAAHHHALLPPRLALDDVTFTIDIFVASGSNTLSFTVATRDADAKTSRFQFEVDLSGRNMAVGQVNYWSIRWMAV
ncbi:hypothetical protein GUJ93_ZPchr0009g1349 [Zizania palustris]|uniref:Uncharacterized protein n=1 Tax=Zizania palustris TaxID=103762 RepID=A0A8J5R1J1_ZIZPA|nr:hypothetical protein GUJ93_ZPchr0009g1349 [Zizania palustris]